MVNINTIVQALFKYSDFIDDLEKLVEESDSKFTASKNLAAQVFKGEADSLIYTISSTQSSGKECFGYLNKMKKDIADISNNLRK